MAISERTPSTFQMAHEMKGSPKPQAFLGGGWTEQLWAAEADLILSTSIVATERTVARRRHLIEKSGGQTWPLHLMRDPQLIIFMADDDRKPKMWLDFGLCAMPSRAWYEWFWFRGREPKAPRTKIPSRVARGVVERDWPECQICGGTVGLNEHHLDHIIPWSLGGPDSIENLRLTHDLCNMARGVGNGA